MSKGRLLFCCCLVRKAEMNNCERRVHGLSLIHIFPSMLDGVADYIKEGKMVDYQDHHYPTEMAVDALIQTYLIQKDTDAFLAGFDQDWQRYNRDLIAKVQRYEEEHPDTGAEGGTNQ